MNLEIITVGNGSKDYPGDFTNLEQEIIKKYCYGNVLNLFSGISRIGDVRVDFSNPNATVNMDVFEYLDQYNLAYFFRFSHRYNTIIIDAPYNQKFADKYQKIGNTPKQFIIFASVEKTTKLFNLIISLNPERIIIKSWNYYIPKGYKLLKGFICYPGGYRKSTVLEILERG